MFPPICLCCERQTQAKQLFCSECMQELLLILPDSRCRYCFDPLMEETILCKYCTDHPPCYRKGAVWEAGSCSLSLYRHLHSLPHLVKVAAAYCVVQLSELQWPSFDLVTYLPRPHCKEIFPLAKEISTFLDIPLRSLFIRYPSYLFEWDWELSQELSYKKILIIDDERQREDGYLSLFQKKKCQVYVFSLISS